MAPGARQWGRWGAAGPTARRCGFLYGRGAHLAVNGWLSPTWLDVLRYPTPPRPTHVISGRLCRVPPLVLAAGAYSSSSDRGCCVQRPPTQCHNTDSTGRRATSATATSTSWSSRTPRTPSAPDPCSDPPLQVIFIYLSISFLNPIFKPIFNPVLNPQDPIRNPTQSNPQFNLILNPIRS